MARKPQDVTDAELAVLRVLWNRSAGTIRELTDILYPGGEVSEYATVQKLLERLEHKRFVKRDRRGSVHLLSPRVDRDELIGRRLAAMAENLCGGSFTPLLSHLVDSGRLDAADRVALRDLVASLEAKPGRGKRR